MSSTKPLVGVTCDRSNEAPHHLHQVGEKYVRSIIDGVDGIPVIIPALADDLDIDALLERLDGVLITGSYSMLEPKHYGGTPAPEGTLTDPARDATAMALIRGALKKGIPLLCICRGFQELNVVHGGSLEQAVHNKPGFMDHREDKSASYEAQYAPSHDIQIQPGGLLEQIWQEPSVKVNSIHEQGVDRLGKGLKVEAQTGDGLVEAVSVMNAKEFCLGLQFHPEYKLKDNDFYKGIFHLFKQACERRLNDK